jgi:probable F420-dependent oxidoreductase
MSLAACLLSSSEKLTIGSSIANIYARDSFTAQRAMVSLNAHYGGRFILGLGVSHIPMVEGVRGHRYEKPLAAMSAYLDGINKSAPLGELPPVVVAALGPKMLALSGAKSRGAVPYNVTPQHTAQVAAILGASKWLAVEQKVTLETDPAKARALGRKELSRYMVLPNYRNSWLRQGFTEAELAVTGSSMGWYSRVMPRRSGAACGRTSRPAPRMSVCSLSTPMAISPLATACWPRSPRPERVYSGGPQSRSATALW